MTYPFQDESGTLFESAVPELTGASHEALLESLGSGSAENPQAAVTGGGSFKPLGGSWFAIILYELPSKTPITPRNKCV